MRIRVWNSARETHSSSQPETRDGTAHAGPLVIHRAIQTEPQATHSAMQTEPQGTHRAMRRELADIDIMATASSAGPSPTHYDTAAQGSSECSPPEYACPNFPLRGKLGLDWEVLREEAKSRKLEPTYYELALAYNGGESAWEIAAEISKDIRATSQVAALSCRTSLETDKIYCESCDERLFGVTDDATDDLKQLSNEATADLANVLFVVATEAAIIAVAKLRARAEEMGCTHVGAYSQDRANGPLTWCQMAAPADG